MFNEPLLSEIRDRFHHVDNCPYQGPRVFFENAGGSLTLKSVVEVNTRLASIPDNQGRDNPASHDLVRIINQSREDMRTFLGAEQGPYNLSVNEEVGLLVEGFEYPPYIMMGHACPYYATQVSALGYHQAQDLLAYLIPTDFEAPPIMTRLAALASDKVKVRCLRRKQLAEEAEVMREIFNDAWQNNWGFVPFTREEYADLVKTLALLLPDEYVQIAEYEGEPAAFMVALPNINEAARDLGGKLLPFGWAKLLWRLKVKHPKSMRVPLLGVKQKFQHSRLGPTMVFMLTDAQRPHAIARGVETAELGWILEDNAGMRNIVETIGGKAYKRYRLYEKDLT